MSYISKWREGQRWGMRGEMKMGEIMRILAMEMTLEWKSSNITQCQSLSQVKTEVRIHQVQISSRKEVQASAMGLAVVRE
jgi:hypothetical protein